MRNQEEKSTWVKCYEEDRIKKDPDDRKDFMSRGEGGDEQRSGHKTYAGMCFP